MSNLANFSEELLLTWLLTASSATRPTAWYVALHMSDPGEAGGAGEVSTAEDLDYVRKAITFADPVADSGQVVSTNSQSWTVDVASAGYTVTHVSIKDAATSGNTLFKAPLPVPRALVAAQVMTFGTGDLICALA